MSTFFYQESSLQISYGTALVVSNTDMKKHLRVTASDEDSLIEVYNRAAQRMAENYTRLLFSPGEATQVFKVPENLTGELFFSLGIGNVSAISGVLANTKEDSAFSVAVTSDYSLLSGFNKPRVYFSNGLTFADSAAANQLQITYDAGFASGAVPHDIQVAIMLICADMYENRMDSIKQLPTAAEVLLNPYQVNQGV